ncbi:MAG TPA: hypothetical protein VGE65_00980 [Sphingobium sp.]
MTDAERQQEGCDLLFQQLDWVVRNQIAWNKANPTKPIRQPHLVDDRLLPEEGASLTGAAAQTVTGRCPRLRQRYGEDAVRFLSRDGAGRFPQEFGAGWVTRWSFPSISADGRTAVLREDMVTADGSAGGGHRYTFERDGLGKWRQTKHEPLWFS